MLEPDEFSAHSLTSANGYIQGVIDGSVVCGRLVRLAVKRHVRDIESPGRFVFSVEKAMRVYRFFSFLRHWKGEYAGTQFLLSPWQAFIMLPLFGWLTQEGTRRFSVAYIQIGRKNGKTSLAAGIGLYMLSADSEPGAEVYSVGTKRDQARISHHDAIEMRRRSPELSERIESWKDNLCIPQTSSKFEPLGANINSMDGLNTHAAIMDELHRHRTRDIWDVMDYSTGARRQPLMLGITTAGNNADSYCYELREHSQRVLEGSVQDDSLFAYIAEPDAEDDLDNERVWIKGNPNLDVSLRMADLRDDFERARAIPSALSNFRRYRINKWVTGASETGIDIDAWKECDGPVQNSEGRVWYGGLDLASTQDIAAWVLFSPCADDAPALVRPYFFVPRDNIAERAKRYRIPLEQWVEQEYVYATPGNVIDYAFIESIIKESAQDVNIKEVAYDDWNATQIVTTLSESLTMIPLQQTIKTFHGPLKLLSDLIAARKLAHGGNPVLRWMASNVHVVSDPSGRDKPVKRDGKRHYKIDGITAMLMGMARAIAHEVSNEKPFESVYATRGIRVV